MLNAYLDFALEISEKAGEILMTHFGKNPKITYKSGDFRNPVSEADIETEKFIQKAINDKFPDHNLICEEGNSLNKENSNYTWIVDPLDGTSNFIHQNPYFAVSIVLVKEKKPILGVVYAPYLKEKFFAASSSGAFLNSAKIQVSEINQMQQALVSTGFSKRSFEKNLPYMQKINENCGGLRRSGSAAIDLCFVSCGRSEAHWEFLLEAWDIAAGVIIVEEAGGKVTNINGQEIDLFAGQILATNGKVHQEFLQLTEMNLSKTKP
jgi:myo-inositol-1(or 4)-monophosphatase